MSVRVYEREIRLPTGEVVHLSTYDGGAIARVFGLPQYAVADHARDALLTLAASYRTLAVEFENLAGRR